MNRLNDKSGTGTAFEVAALCESKPRLAHSACDLASPPSLLERVLCEQEASYLSQWAIVFADAWVLWCDADAGVRRATASFSDKRGTPCRDVVGRRLHDLVADDWGEERRVLIGRSIDSSRPLFTAEVFAGRRLEGMVVPATLNGARTALYMGRYAPVPGASASLGHSVPCHSLAVPDWGHLGMLSARERDVLREIAVGRDNDSIAKAMHRTRRAVEWQISNLYRRLGCAHRGDLLREGLLAGLGAIPDAHWNRLQRR